MEITVKELEDSLVVELAGEFDLHTADDFSEEIETRIKQGYNKIILDLAKVEFIDSSGIGAIISKYKDLTNQGGVLTAVNLTPQVERIFEVSGIFRIVDVYSTRQEAVQNI
ncbi:STAS domain-containing protein [Halanaerobaculum tunisiense]